MEDDAQVKVKQYKTCIIVPFSYSNKFFEGMLQERKEKDQDDEKKEIHTNKVFNEYFRKKWVELDGPFNAEETLTENCEENRRTLQCYTISDKGWKELGLSQNRKQTYILEKQETEFRIEDIKVWFFKNGRGYLTLKVQWAGELPADLKTILEFNATKWMNKKGEFKKKPRQQEICESGCIKMKTMVEQCLGMLKGIGVKGRITEKKIYYLTLVMTDAEGVHEDILHRIILKFPFGKTINTEQKIMQSYDPYSYIHWKVTGNAVAVMTDNSVTQEKDRNALKDFDNRVFNHYLIAYLYYLSKYNKYEQLKDEWDSGTGGTVNQMRDKIEEETEVSKIAAIRYEHMDKLFYDILCGQAWDYFSKVKRFKEKVKYDVFISYRHDGGQYLALLLYEHLTKKHINVFWDKYCLRAGHFDEQLYEQIGRSRNLIVILSPQCIERLTEEDDWICKELYGAFRNKQSEVPVLMVSMENVMFPDKKMVGQLMQSENMKKLSEESRKRVEIVLEELKKCQGISADVSLFDGVINRIEAALHLENYSKRHSGKN